MLSSCSPDLIPGDPAEVETREPEHGLISGMSVLMRPVS